MVNFSNSKTFGIMLMVFVGAIVALSLMPSIGKSVQKMTGTVDAVNASYTAPAINATIDIGGQEYFGSAIVSDAIDLNNISLNSDNYTITEGISSSTGLKKSGGVTNW